MQIQEVFDRRRFVFLDGGMGTQLQQRGLQPGAAGSFNRDRIAVQFQVIPLDRRNVGIIFNDQDAFLFHRASPLLFAGSG